MVPESRTTATRGRRSLKRRGRRARTESGNANAMGVLRGSSKDRAGDGPDAPVRKLGALPPHARAAHLRSQNGSNRLPTLAVSGDGASLVPARIRWTRTGAHTGEKRCDPGQSWSSSPPCSAGWRVRLRARRPCRSRRAPRPQRPPPPCSRPAGTTGATGTGTIIGAATGIIAATIGTAVTIGTGTTISAVTGTATTSGTAAVSVPGT